MHIVMASLPVAFYLLAVVLGIQGVQQPYASNELSPMLQWMLTLSLGVPSLWAAIGHGFNSEHVTKSIGWETLRMVM